MDTVLFVLMSLILLLNTNDLKASNLQGDVEKSQVKYVKILHKYLRSKKHLQGCSYSFLHRGLMMIEATSRIQDLERQKLNLRL